MYCMCIVMYFYAYCVVLYFLPSPKVYLAGNFDMDVSVDSGWWREEGNQARLQQAMEARGIWRVSSVSLLAHCSASKQSLTDPV